MASSVALGAVPMLSQPLNFSQYDAVSVSVSNRPVSVSFPKLSPPPPPLIYCGRGDKKTAKGKRFRHSFGNARPRDKKKGRGPPRPPVPQSPPKKDPFHDDGVDKIAIDGSLFSSQ